MTIIWTIHISSDFSELLAKNYRGYNIKATPIQVDDEYCKLVVLWAVVVWGDKKLPPSSAPRTKKVKTSCECQQWSLSFWEMPSVKLLSSLAFLAEGFFLGSCIQWDEDKPGELILLRAKMWRCSVFANYTASPDAFSKARFVKLPRPQICIFQKLLSQFKIIPLNSKVHLQAWAWGR